MILPCHQFVPEPRQVKPVSGLKVSSRQHLLYNHKLLFSVAFVAQNAFAPTGHHILPAVFPAEVVCKPGRALTVNILKREPATHRNVVSFNLNIYCCGNHIGPTLK